MAGTGRQRKESAAVVMQRLDFNPLKLLIDRANTLKDGDPEKTKVALELLPYAYGKLRTIEHTAGEGTEVTITIGGAPALPNQVKPDD